MPEEHDSDCSSSGNLPEERKPTVIGGRMPAAPPAEAQPERKPTSIGGQPATSPAQTPSGHKPTAISGAPASPQHPTPAGPTVLGGGQPAKPLPTAPPTSIAPTPPPAPAKPMTVTHPTALPGKARKFIEVDADALLKLYPGTPEEVLAKAKLILGGTMIENLTEDMCMRWGEDVQRRFGELTERSSQLIGVPAISDCGRHLQRLNLILQEISEALSGKSGGLFRRVDPKKEYEQNKQEIQQIKDLLENLLPVLLQSKGDLDTVSTQITKLAVEIHGSSIAAQYIADHLLDQGDNKTQLLTGRGRSLTETYAFTQQGQLLRGQTGTSLTLLVSQVQDTVLMRVPVWMESVAAVLNKPSWTDTDLYNLRQGLTGILSEIGKE